MEAAKARAEAEAGARRSLADQLEAAEQAALALRAEAERAAVRPSEHARHLLMRLLDRTCRTQPRELSLTGLRLHDRLHRKHGNVLC